MTIIPHRPPTGPISEEQRREAAERLREYQPAKGQSVLDLVRQRSEQALESPFATPVV